MSKSALSLLYLALNFLIFSPGVPYLQFTYSMSITNIILWPPGASCCIVCRRCNFYVAAFSGPPSLNGLWFALLSNVRNIELVELDDHYNTIQYSCRNLLHYHYVSTTSGCRYVAYSIFGWLARAFLQDIVPNTFPPSLMSACRHYSPKWASDPFRTPS